MQDNIDLLQSKIQSRKRALRPMEYLFEARFEEPISDDMTIKLSHIMHLKNKFMKQVLQETSVATADIQLTDKKLSIRVEFGFNVQLIWRRVSVDSVSRNECYFLNVFKT